MCQKLEQFKLVWNTLGLESTISAIVADARLIAKGQAHLELPVHNTNEVPASLIEDKHINVIIGLSQRFVTAVCRSGLSQRFVVVVCRSCLSQRFDASVCRSGLSQRFVAVVFRSGLSQRFSIVVCRSGLSQWFVAVVYHSGLS
ncbi:hypothetical protein Tco_0901409 [Tanacetum coccineum]